MKLFVKISSNKYLKNWGWVIEDNPGIDIYLVENENFVDYCLKNSSELNHIIICEESIIIGKYYETRISNLIKELNYYIPNWAVASSRGMSFNNENINYDRNIENGSFPIKSAYPKIASILNGNLLLINLKKLHENNIAIPNSGSIGQISVELSKQAIMKKLLPVVDHRLMVFDHEKILSVKESKLSEDQFDEALIASQVNKKPSLTIICRTQFERGELLDRGIESFRLAIENSKDLVSVEILIVTDKDENVLQKEIVRLKNICSNTVITGKRIENHSERYSRTNLMYGAIEIVDTDYMWFVDDDDYIDKYAILNIGRNLSNSGKSFLIGNAYGNYEIWNDNKLTKSSTIKRYESKNIYEIYRGQNLIPLCSCVFPLEAIKNQIKNLKLVGDYQEDTTLIILTLASPVIELCLIKSIISNISIRDSGNTITQEDRSWCNYSYINFFSELIDSKNSGSIIMWQIATQEKVMMKNSFLHEIANYLTIIYESIFKHTNSLKISCNMLIYLTKKSRLGRFVINLTSH